MKPIFAGILLFLISLILAVAIFVGGGKLGIAGLTNQVVVWTCLVFVISLIFFFPVIARALWLRWSERHSGVSHLNPEIVQDKNSESARLIGAAQRWEHLKQFHRLTNQYKKHRKPWILVLGDDALIEKVFPGIKENLWVENHNAFWLDAHAVEPAGGWSALRGSGKRPVEGLVCLSEERNSGERFATQQQEVLEKINWLVPVNRVFVVDGHNDSELVGIASHRINAYADKNKIKMELDVFANQLAELGTFSIEENVHHIFAAALSKRLNLYSEDVAEATSADKRTLGKLDFLDSISFVQSNRQEAFPDLIFKSFDSAKTLGKGKKLKWSRIEKVFLGMSVAALMFTGIFAYAAYHSYQDFDHLQTGLKHLQTNPVTPTSYSSLVDLQNHIIQMENNQTGFNGWLVNSLGYSHSKKLLEAAYDQYGQAAQQAIVIPTANKLMDDLYELNGLSAVELGAVPEAGNKFFNVLKAYLMLTERVDKVDSAFLMEKMTAALNQQGLQTPQTRDVVAFFSKYLSEHKNWALDGNVELVGGSRQILATWIGSGQAEDHIYNRIIADGKERYPEVILAKLLNRDIRGIWSVTENLPGIYTARGWEEYVKPEFAKAAQNNNSDDWVLAGNLQSRPVSEAAINSLKERYFNEYAAAWFDVLNSMVWLPRTKNLDAVNQLHVYADPQRSPLIALFDIIKANGELEGKQIVLNSEIAQQVKRVANSQISARGRQVLDTLLENQEDQIDAAQEQVAQYIEGSLQSKFGTLLQLVDVNVNPKSDLSLQRYLEKITATKQRLIQIAGASDAGAAARVSVQSVVKGDENEFTDGLQYARLIEASIGDSLLPFARNVFVLPFYTAWDTITGSAQRDINNMWSQTLVIPLKADLGGRYPFSPAETEVSIPMMAKYLEPNQGLVDQFIESQLSGVLTKQGSRWVENPGQNLKVNKEFINQVNKLGSVANDLFVSGEGGYTFELKPAATPGIVQFNLSLDGQVLNYFNQEAEWKSFRWPGDMANAGVRMTWETDDTDLRQTQELSGRLGFIRLLEKARITPVDRSTYLVEMPVAQEQTIRFYMRTNSGKGPLGFLDLRNIYIPSQVFEAGR